MFYQIFKAYQPFNHVLHDFYLVALSHGKYKYIYRIRADESREADRSVTYPVSKTFTWCPFLLQRSVKMPLFLHFLIKYPFLKELCPTRSKSILSVLLCNICKAKISIFDKKLQQILLGSSKVWKSEKNNFPFFKYSNSLNDSKS